MREEVNSEREQALKAAVKVLREGGIILYPTDTVWGIGCDATNVEAVAKVYALKRREDAKALVLLASGLDMVGRYVKEIPEIAVQLVEVNDKPMTIIYPGAVIGPYGLAANVVAQDGSVGIRIPLGGFAAGLARRFGKPFVSTSENFSGEPTPRSFAEISDEIRSAVDLVVEPCFEQGAAGVPSSIIKVGLDYSIEIIRK